MLEMIGDLPEADAKPPTSVLFVCKLNAVTSEVCAVCVCSICMLCFMRVCMVYVSVSFCVCVHTRVCIYIL